MSKLTRDEIIMRVDSMVHPPKPRKVDSFGRVLEWEGDDADDLVEGIKEAFYIVRKSDAKAVEGPFKGTKTADARLKAILEKEGIDWKDWRKHPYQVIDGAYLALDKAVGKWTKKPKKEDVDLDDGNGLEERSAYAACLPAFDNKDIPASLARWETFAAEIVKAIPASLRKVAAVFHKAVEREFFHSAVDDDKDDAEANLHERYDLFDERSAYAGCLPKSDRNDISSTLARWETFAAEVVKAIPPSLRKAAVVFHKAVEREFFHSAVDDDKDDAEANLDEDVDHDLLDEGKKGKLKKALKFKNGDEAPAGTAVEVEFDKNRPEMALLKLDLSTDNRDYMADPAKLGAGKVYLYVGGFSKPPSIKTMMKWSDDGMSKTVTGKKVEPDGVGPDGSPSWLRVLGYI